MRDIHSKEDIALVVNSQYRLLLDDSFTAPVFGHLNLEEHLPKIFTFWCFILDIESENNAYRGSAFEPHTRLGLTAAHFEKWMHFLHSSIENNFEGAIAEKWIAKSKEFDFLFRYKMGLMDDDSQLIGIKK